VATSDPLANHFTEEIVPSGSEAVAASATVAGAAPAGPAAGLVSVTVGTLLTVMETGDDVAVKPLLSVATAVTEYVPVVTFDHVTLYGLVVSVPMSVPLA